jgi:hypothetical protein
LVKIRYDNTSDRIDFAKVLLIYKVFIKHITVLNFPGEIRALLFPRIMD